jgi:hypothetical protein
MTSLKATEDALPETRRGGVNLSNSQAKNIAQKWNSYEHRNYQGILD